MAQFVRERFELRFAFGIKCGFYADGIFRKGEVL